MALPEITMPSGTPPFLADGHDMQPISLYSRVKRGQGATRNRRVRSGHTRLINVSLAVTEDQMKAIEQWHHKALNIGTLPFSARVAAQGVGVMWWEARWTVNPSYTVDKANNWTVTGQLLLSGTPSVSEPQFTTFAANMFVAIKGLAVTQFVTGFQADIYVPFTGVTKFAAAIEVDIKSPD